MPARRAAALIFRRAVKPSRRSRRLSSTLGLRNKYMQHRDFSIGMEFWCGGKRWRCTDVGTRVIVAICLEPRDMVRSEPHPTDKTKRVQTHFVSNDPRDLSGPPYGVAESVFDEYDVEACRTENDEVAP